MLKHLGSFLKRSFALFMLAGFIPVVGGAFIANLIGYHAFAEYLIVLGLVVWLAARTATGWLMERSWKKAEALRLEQGLESPGDGRRRQKWEREKRRKKERLREVMRLMQRDGGKRSNQRIKAATKEFCEKYR